jgi:predicted phage terminase large subunit-like protein
MNEQAIFRAALASDLVAFLEKVFPEIDPRGDLQLANYVLHLNDVLQRVSTAQDKRVIINLPPRHLKSILISVVWPAWLLGRNPAMRIAVVSHSQPLARDLGLKALRLVESEVYRQIFPQTVLRDDRHQAHDFETSEGGGRYAASFATGITGRGFDLIIVDDPISAHDARSEVERDRVNDVFDSMILSRLDDPRRGAVVIVGQRLHENDLSGYLLTKGGWKHVSLPLIAEEAVSLQIGSKIWTRNVGDVLLPELWPAAVVEEKRKSVGEAIFSAQYQQDPAAAVGELIRPEQLRLVDDLPPGNLRRTLSFDTAVKTGPTSSFTVCLVIATDCRRHYIEDVLRARLDPVQARDAALGLIETYKPSKILIEDASSGPGLAKMLAERHYHAELCPTGGLSKEQRLEPHLHMFTEGRILVKSHQSWSTVFINELARFPFGAFDDQVDALTQYLAWAASSLRATPPIIASVDGAETRMMRALMGRTRPLQKGEHSMRPRRGGFRCR